MNVLSPYDACLNRSTSRSNFAYVSIETRKPKNSMTDLIVRLLLMCASLRSSGSQHPIVFATTFQHGADALLEKYNIMSRRIPHVTPEQTRLRSCARDTIAKIVSWSLYEFDAILLLDLDMHVFCNLDDLFHIPIADNSFAAVSQGQIITMKGKKMDQHNSGLQLIKPSRAVFERIKHTVMTVEAADLNVTCSQPAYYRGDQRITAYHFGIVEGTKFHAIPQCFNDLSGKGGGRVVFHPNTCVYHMDALQDTRSVLDSLLECSRQRLLWDMRHTLRNVSLFRRMGFTKHFEAYRMQSRPACNWSFHKTCNVQDCGSLS